MLETFMVGNLVVDRLSIPAGGDDAGPLEQVEVLRDVLQRTPSPWRDLVYGQLLFCDDPQDEQPAGIAKRPA